jgi:prophage maintenance system killer protein
MGAALTFLEANGIETDKFNDDDLYEAMIAIAEKRMTKADPAGVFRRVTR